MYKKIFVDTLKVRARVLNESYKNGDWNGEHPNHYCRRKTTKEKMTTIIKGFVNVEIKQIKYNDSCKECYIYIDRNECGLIVADQIVKKGLNSYYIGLTS